MDLEVSDASTNSSFADIDLEALHAKIMLSNSMDFHLRAVYSSITAFDQTCPHLWADSTFEDATAISEEEGTQVVARH